MNNNKRTELYQSFREEILMDHPEEFDEGIHSSAYVHPEAELGKDVSVGPFSYVGKGVKIGDECVLANHVNIRGNTEIGNKNLFFPNSSIGTPPQDLSYRGKRCGLQIGNRNVFRECVTVNYGTKKDIGKTKIGSDNFLMAYVHIAHDCVLEDRIVFANGVQIGGHVTIASDVNFGGLAAVHHFVTIGKFSFVGGQSALKQDVPPFMKAAGNPAEVRAVNKVGLKRNGFSTQDVRSLKEAYKKIYRCNGSRKKRIEQLKNQSNTTSEVDELVQFLLEVRATPNGRKRELERSF